MLLDCLPAGCSHDALVLRTAALGVVVVLHAKVVSHLMRHRCGYQSHQPIIVLSTTKKNNHTSLCTLLSIRKKGKETAWLVRFRHEHLSSHPWKRCKYKMPVGQPRLRSDNASVAQSYRAATLKQITQSSALSSFFLKQVPVNKLTAKCYIPNCCTFPFGAAKSDPCITSSYSCNYRMIKVLLSSSCKKPDGMCTISSDHWPHKLQSFVSCGA